MTIDNKRILICQPFIYQINGSMMVTLELAEELKKTAKEVVVYSDIVDLPAKAYFEKKKIKIVSYEDDPQFELEDFDVVWVHSQTMPKSLIRKMANLKEAKNIPKFVFLHMSSLGYILDEKPWIYQFEEKLADKILVIAEDTKAAISKYIDNPKVDYYRNPAPDEYICKKKRTGKLEKVLIVSNHCPEEVLEARKELKKKGVEVKLLGEDGVYRPVTPQMLEKYDAVISIGKTVQYCLLAGIPVYVYDHFGGPGYLTEKTFKACKENNFSGRDSREKKTAKEIADEVLSGFKESREFIWNNRNEFRKEFSLGERLKDIFASLESKKKENFSNEYISYVEMCQDMARHNMFYGSYDAFRKKNELGNAIKALKQENADQKEFIQSVANSYACRAILHFRRRLGINKKSKVIEKSIAIAKAAPRKAKQLPKYIKKHAKKSPEIILVCCVYNEERNMELFLRHIEKYIDGIVMVDDNSSDATVEILKKHKKVLSVVNTNNPHTDNTYDERGMRKTAILEAKRVAKTKKPFVLCMDPDERLETRLLKKLKYLAKEYAGSKKVLTAHYRELWGSRYTYRCDGIWGEKIRPFMFQLSDKMTFSFPHQYHVPWAYDEIVSNTEIIDYSFYHLKMIRQIDRIARKDLYNSLDPNKKIQSIGYDYLADEKGLTLKKIDKVHEYQFESVPDYYRQED